MFEIELFKFHQLDLVSFVHDFCNKNFLRLSNLMNRTYLGDQ